MLSIGNCIVLSVLFVLQRPTYSLQESSNLHAENTRRQVLSKILSAGAICGVAPPLLAANAETSSRDQLLAAIADNKSDDMILNIISNLQDPSGGRAATLPDWLDGEWELIWSYKAQAFSPLLKLPPPLRPNSYQYLGSAAAREVGERRLAQGLTGGILGNAQIWLSSGAMPYEKDPSVLEILPPFRYQLGGRSGSGWPKKTIIEAASDAEFRKTNARTTAEQMAGKNQYRQMYLENDGPGSLRISSVIAGDPVIVGSVFIHRKL